MSARARRQLAELEADAQRIGRAIGSGLSPNTGFALLLFNKGPGGFTTYVSNCRREDMIAAMKEWISHAGTGTIAPPGQPGHPANTRGDA